MVSIIWRSRKVLVHRCLRLLSRGFLFASLLVIVTFSPVSPHRDISEGLAVVSRQATFSIVRWEARAILDKAATIGRLQARPDPADSDEQVPIVRTHFDNVREIERLRGERDRLFSEQRRDRDALDAIEAQLLAREETFDREHRQIESIIAKQIESNLLVAGIRPSLFAPGNDGWPIPFIRVYPNVFFTYQRLPQNLLIAPRDRVAIIGSVLVSPDLTTGAIEDLETRTDRLGVASLVIGIGGLGTFPSMIPDTEPLRRGLDVIAHEWTHHYLAFRPLGRAFFSNYEMRALNELVADMVGEEIGKQTFEQYYQGTEPAPPAVDPSVARTQPATPRPDFGREMRRIRIEVERLLAAHDTDGAEKYMQEQRAVMSELGWNIRRLNTAYLSFFGAYTGGANRNEPPLRALRARTGSLVEFLRVVEQITSPEQLATIRR